MSDTKGASVLISIPREIYERIKRRIEGTEFQSVENYIMYVLEQVTSEASVKHEVYSDEDKKNIEGRLRALGYI